MQPAERAQALIRFLLQREPSATELRGFDDATFDADRFTIKLLCSDEAAERYGDVTQHFIDHLRQERSSIARPHKLAHDLVLLREDLGALQTSFDRMHGQMIELLRQEDRIGGVFEAIRSIQSDVNKVRTRLDRAEADMLRMEA